MKFISNLQNNLIAPACIGNRHSASPQIDRNEFNTMLYVFPSEKAQLTSPSSTECFMAENTLRS